MLQTSNKKCTGCAVCSYICPQKCIEMKVDDEHFVAPIVNGEKCTNCNLCNKICPINNKKIEHMEKKCYVGQLKDENKLKKSGYTEEQCLNVIRKHFNSYKSNTIVETEKGVFEGQEEDWNAFGETAKFPYTSWFLKVIKEWYWYVDEGDGLGLQKEDCLQSYYEVKAVNA